ncbi:30S ribosomal protein S18 [Mycoplasmoides alvi]|uniref:30S ribosomal protein S18 n=1 Tax=Mycoplasmoides alvi TaxID=78580 RepID=UPI00051BC5B2|nr:30S ribosomal protein S18 [Mycoplasmoides alvi]
MSDNLNIKQPANNISEQDAEKVQLNNENKDKNSLGSYTKRNFRPKDINTTGTQANAGFRKKFYRPRGRKICHFCASGVLKIDYKDKELLEKYINSYAKILSRRQIGTCALHQRHLSNAIKRARIIALLPFVRD